MNLNEKIRGALVGFAFGDALGLGTEYMTRHEVESYYPNGLRNFNQIIKDAHRSQWKHGEWSNETRMTTLMLSSVLESGGFVPYNLCKKFQDWFAEEERDIAPYLRLYCTNTEWLENPIRVAHDLWHSSGLAEASNETLHRAVTTGLTSEEENLNEHTRKFVIMTHDDSRCVATTMIMARVIRNALKDRKDNIDNLISLCSTIDNRTLPFLKMAWDGDIESVKVDDPDTQSWTRKGMAAALWGFWHHDSAEDIIYKVIDLGGDSDTNAAMAGVLAGLRYGYNSLPDEKEKLMDLDKLHDLSDRITEFVDQKVFRK